MVSTRAVVTRGHFISVHCHALPISHERQEATQEHTLVALDLHVSARKKNKTKRNTQQGKKYQSAHTSTAAAHAAGRAGSPLAIRCPSSSSTSRMATTTAGTMSFQTTSPRWAFRPRQRTNKAAAALSLLRNATDERRFEKSSPPSSKVSQEREKNIQPRNARTTASRTHRCRQGAAKSAERTPATFAWNHQSPFAGRSKSQRGAFHALPWPTAASEAFVGVQVLNVP